jgi:prepilin-type N-terminal cleavage/methylation domain-containing protein
MRKNRGFTLVEVLVATMLISIVMTAVYTLFHSTTRSWRNLERGFDPYAAARTCFRLMERELENALAGASHLMEGDDSSLTFYAVTEPLNLEKASGRQLLKITYRQGRERSGHTVEREEARVKSAVPMWRQNADELRHVRIRLTDKGEFTLVSHVSRFRIRYVWVPWEPNPDPKLPPPPVAPVYLERHHMTWGYPQGIEFTLVLQDPEDPTREYSFTEVIPIRSGAVRKTRPQLGMLLDSLK